MDSSSTSTSNIPGRGGASLTLISSTPTHHTLLLVFGASREQQFSDMWTVTIDRQKFEASDCKKLNIKETDSFTTRNSMTAVEHQGKVIFFGGQDSEQGLIYNEIFTLDSEKLEIKQHHYAEGQIIPEERNSHTMCKLGDDAYIFGGANSSGPRKDLCKLNLNTLEFSNVKLNEKVVLPSIEMHTAHIYQQSKLLVLGGRGIFPGQAPEEAAFQNVIYSIDLATGEVESFGTLPADLASHCSALVDDKYLILYGGTNGLRFFDSIIRYSIADKKWMLMTGQPQNCKKSRFFQDGRISSSSVQCEDMIILFGGSSFEKECNDFLIIPVEHIRDDKNFSEINEIM